jgi:hypothetical protein
MNPRDLVLAALNGEDLRVRQWVKRAARLKLDYSLLPAPEGLTPDQLAVAAGMVELLAQRSGQSSPAWTRDAGCASHAVYLVPSAARVRRWAEQTPAPLKSRNVFATPDYLDFRVG